MHIKIITIGKKSPLNLLEQIKSYEKRLDSNIKVSWILISHGNSDPNTSKHQESETTLSKIKDSDFVILLDENGQQIDNLQLSNLLFQENREICLIIGGSYGVSQNVIDRADFIWSISKLVLPHMLVRLILAEQIYRSFAIHTSHPYHHS